MDCLFSITCLKKLPHLSPMSFQQIANYLTLLEARNYAQSTLANLALAVKNFITRLPPTRQTRVAEDFTQTTPADIDCFVTSARQQGLQPTTINCSLSLLTQFFNFLCEVGDMQAQLIMRRRHRLPGLKRLPKPMSDPDVVRFFRAIDSLRDRALFLLMLR